jgi:hypothetical protein
MGDHESLRQKLARWQRRKKKRMQCSQRGGPYTATDFDQKIDKIVRASYASQPPEVLYHYTSVDAVCGILRSQEFRATAHYSMSDQAELDSVGDVIREVATEFLNKSSEVERVILRMFLDKYGDWKNSKMFDSFLVCFSQARDKESQWMQYADQGRGLCLGIKVLIGEQPPNDSLPIRGRDVFVVDYDVGSWRTKVRVAFKNIVSELRHFESTSAIDDLQNAHEVAWGGLQRIAAFAETVGKKPCYSSEEEWRIVAIGEKGSPVRRTKDGKAYIPLRLRAQGLLLALDEIMIGPNADASTVRGVVEQILTESGYPHPSAPMPKITVSGLLRSVPL